MFFTLLVIDFGFFEFTAIFLSTFILKKIGQHPAALGKLRNYYLKFGPRAIRSAKVTFGEKPKKKGPASPVKPVEEEKKVEKKKSSGPTDPQQRARLRAKREREKAMAEAKKKREQQQQQKQGSGDGVKDISDGMQVLE
jgi:hypothetical protein